MKGKGKQTQIYQLGDHFPLFQGQNKDPGVILDQCRRQDTDFEYLEVEHPKYVCHKIKNRFFKNSVLICFKMQKQHNVIL